MIAAVARHLHRVLYVEVVEADRRAADGAGKGILHEADMVVVEVHVREHLLEHGVHDLARLQQLVESLRVLSDDDIACLLWVFAVQMVGHRLAHGQRQDILPVVLRLLHALAVPLLRLQFGRVDVVACQRDLLIFHELVVRVVLQVRQFLRLNDAPHQLHGRIVLPFVPLPSTMHLHFRHIGRFRLELKVQHHGVVLHLYLLRLVAYAARHQHVASPLGDGEVSLVVALHTDGSALVTHVGVGHGVAVVGIQHLSGDLRTHMGGEH